MKKCVAVYLDYLKLQSENQEHATHCFSNSERAIWLGRLPRTQWLLNLFMQETQVYCPYVPYEATVRIFRWKSCSDFCNIHLNCCPYNENAVEYRLTQVQPDFQFESWWCIDSKRTRTKTVGFLCSDGRRWQSNNLCSARQSCLWGRVTRQKPLSVKSLWQSAGSLPNGPYKSSQSMRKKFLVWWNNNWTLCSACQISLLAVRRETFKKITYHSATITTIAHGKKFNSVMNLPAKCSLERRTAEQGDIYIYRYKLQSVFNQKFAWNLIRL